MRPGTTSQKNRDVVDRFAKVVEQAAAYTNAHETQTLPLYASFAGMDLDVVKQMHHTYSATSFDPREIQPVIDLAAKYKIIPRGFSASEFIVGGKG
jgi:ABC-type nitrate/sulfonate/bicarbonate transport system substrate-binding protein